MQWGVAISILFPIILFALLAFISLNADHNAFLYVDTAFAFLALIVVFGVNQWCNGESESVWLVLPMCVATLAVGSYCSCCSEWG